MHGAAGCPREHGHSGEHFWWIAWQFGGYPNGYWKVMVYRTSTDPGGGRIAVAKGNFASKPNGRDVLALLQLLTRKRLEEKARAAHARANPQPLVEPPEALPFGHAEDVASNVGAKQEQPRESAAARAARAMVEEARSGQML